MTTHIIIRINSVSPENMQWLSLDEDSLIEHQGICTVDKLCELSDNWQGKPISLLLPGVQCSSILEKIPAKSLRQIRAALPFAVEDHFAEDVDELHFALGERSAENGVSALVVNKQQISHWLQSFEDAGITPKLVTADHQALPRPEDAAVLLHSSHTSLLRLKDGRSFSIENNLLTIMLQQFSKIKADATEKADPTESEEEIVTEKLFIIGTGVDAENEFVQQLSESLSSFWDIQFEKQLSTTTNPSSSDSELLFLAQNLIHSAPINLLQAQFKRSAPSSKNWLMFKWPAIAASVVVVLLLATWTLDYFALKQRLASLKQAHTTVYKKAFPSEKTIVRPVSQMRGKLRAQGSSTEDGVFFPLLSKLSVAIAKVESAKITNINFRATKGVLKIDFLAADFASIQRLQDALKSQQLVVTPGASNASGDKYFGRLTIKEKS